MAWSLLHQDNFNRADGNLDGSTMSDSAGTWGVIIGSWSIATNLGSCTSGSDGSIVRDTAMSDVGDQASEFISQIANNGPTVRVQPAGSFATYYLAFRNGTTVEIYKNNGASPVDYTLLGSSSSGVIANGDTLRIEVEGTTIRGLVNGSDVVSVTDSSFSTGKAGMHNTSNNTSTYESYANYLVSSASVPGNSTKFLNLMGVGT